jgi:hypothetical protein
MDKIVESHVAEAIAWQHEKKFGVTKEQRDSLFMLIDEYQRIKAENGALRDVLAKAASIGLAHGIGNKG